jgi:iron complex transport system substrate-binding protein
LEGVLDDAFQFNSVLSLPMVLDQVVPMIEAVLEDQADANAAAAPRDALIAEGIAKARAFTPALTPTEVTSEHRLIEQGAFGEAKVPLAPKRIVTLDPSLTDTVIALGYGDAIAGTIVDYNGDVFHEHVAPLLKPDTAKLGQEGSPNLERVVAARPDLILTWDWYPDNIAQLQQIAPTVVMPYTTYEHQIGQTYSNEQYVTWLVREAAAVLGVENRVDTALQPFREKKAAGRAALADALGDQTVGFVDIRKEKILLSGYGSDGISALLYGDLGVRPDPLTDALYVWEDLSLEKVPELTADLMLAFVDGDDARQRYDELTRNPLWQKVPAVKNGKVFIVPSGLYYRGDDGPLGAARVVDDIVLKLTGKPL